MHDPIAYTYESDYHCPRCTADHLEAGHSSEIPGDAEDNEANPIGALFSRDEWAQGTGACETLSCGDCADVIDHAHADPHSEGCPEYEAPDDDQPDYEGDGFVSPTNDVTLDGKHIGRGQDQSDAYRILAQAMETAQYWPNCWYVSDHGNAELIADIADYARLAGVWDLCERPPQGAEAVADLYDWSTNHDPGKGPFTLFLDLLGWSQEELGEPLYNLNEPSLGYVELSKLADALTEYVASPEDVRAFVTGLMAAEGRS